MPREPRKDRKPKFMRTIESPKIQVLLTLVEGEKDRYDCWLVLDVPDGRPPTTVLLAASLDRSGAMTKIHDIFTTIGERHGFPEMTTTEKH